MVCYCYYYLAALIALNKRKNPTGMPLDEGKASTTPPNEEIYSLAQSFSGHKKVKRKIVLVIGYLGTNFRGMQIHREAGKQAQPYLDVMVTPN